MYNHIRERRLEAKEIIAMSWGLFTENFQAFALTYMAICLPVSLLSMYIPPNIAKDEQTFMLLSIGMFLLELCVAVPLALMAVAKLCDTIIHSAASGKVLSSDDVMGEFKHSIEFAFGKVGSYLQTYILQLCIIIPLCFLFIIPGVIWMAYYFFAVFAVALRDKSGKSALDYSKDLVDGQWGAVLWMTARLGFNFSWRAVLVGLLYAVLVYLPLGFIAPEDSTELITSIMDDVIMYALLPFLYVMHTIYFLNLDYLRSGSTERQDSETQDLVDA